MAHLRRVLWTILLVPGLAVAAFARPADLEILPGDDPGLPVAPQQVRPLEMLVIPAPGPGTVTVRDGRGEVYFSAAGKGPVRFRAGGAAGGQTVEVRDAGGAVTARAAFTLAPKTMVDDGGKYRDMFALFRAGMNAYSPTGVETSRWNGRTYRFFVTWVLDNFNTAKGMKYFSPDLRDFVEMMRSAQREDGMIWSNINPGDAVAYYETAYGPFDYIRRIGDRYFVRQPAENHPEYNYVSTIYQSWKATADDPWMEGCLSSAMRALDYCVTDPARWSRRFQLLKRVYTIDSWDFQVDDRYTPDLGLTNTMLVDPVKSKFGVFFGDNVYYAAACEELDEMLGHARDRAGAAKYAGRAAAIRQRLDALAWNGRFFTHFIDEDPTVHRDLGVDERFQIAQGNAYALNRGVDRAHAVAILQTYLDLKAHLPVGSPGEWYAIYPPFGRGFGRHDAMWQYMNGGVGGHVAGELARGAFENGYEAYGRDILDRLDALGRRTGQKISFAYTGSIPPPPPAPRYTPVDLAAAANMDFWVQGGPAAAPWMLSHKAGDDLRGLPTGDQTFAGIRFHVTDPAGNARRAVVAVSHRPGLPPAVEIAVNAPAAALYLLHTATKPGTENVCGSVRFNYADGTHEVQYLMMGKQLTYWWFPELKTDRSGVAWHGPSPASRDVGLSWCAIDNPHPDRPIASLCFSAPEDDGVYTLVGLTLADRPHYVAPDPVSFGGPDNWAAATAMAALIEGLAGVKDGPLSEGYAHPRVAPRWDLSSGHPVAATVCYPASGGYVAYRVADEATARRIAGLVTGNAAAMDGHFLLPGAAGPDPQVTVNGAPVASQVSRVGDSRYVDFPLVGAGVRTFAIHY